MAKLGRSSKEAYDKMLKDLPASLAGKRTRSFHKIDVSKYVNGPDVRAVRTAIHLSQPVFAAGLGLSPSTVRAWENGRCQPLGLESKVIRLLQKKPKFFEDLAHI